MGLHRLTLKIGKNQRNPAGIPPAELAGQGGKRRERGAYPEVLFPDAEIVQARGKRGTAVRGE